MNTRKRKSRSSVAHVEDDSLDDSISTIGKSDAGSPEVQEPDFKKFIMDSIAKQSALLEQMEQTINGQYRIVLGINNGIENLQERQRNLQEGQRNLQTKLKEGHDEVLRRMEEVRDDVLSNLHNNAARTHRFNEALGTTLRGINQTLRRVADLAGQDEPGLSVIPCNLCGRQVLETGMRQHHQSQICIQRRQQ